MRYKYSKYVADLLDGLDLEDLVSKLSDLLLSSGFQNPYGASWMNEDDRSLQALHDAILEACAIRFRPIMMTTMAALMGTLPIAIGFGAGAEARRPLGLAVVGGLAFSQLITLYVTPVFYTYLDDFQRRFQRRPRSPRSAATRSGRVHEPAEIGRR